MKKITLHHEFPIGSIIHRRRQCQWGVDENDFKVDSVIFELSQNGIEIAYTLRGIKNPTWTETCRDLSELSIKENPENIIALDREVDVFPIGGYASYFNHDTGEIKDVKISYISILVPTEIEEYRHLSIRYRLGNGYFIDPEHLRESYDEWTKEDILDVCFELASRCESLEEKCGYLESELEMRED